MCCICCPGEPGSCFQTLLPRYRLQRVRGNWASDSRIDIEVLDGHLGIFKRASDEAGTTFGSCIPNSAPGDEQCKAPRTHTRYNLLQAHLQQKSSPQHISFLQWTSRPVAVRAKLMQSPKPSLKMVGKTGNKGRGCEVRS